MSQTTKRTLGIVAGVTGGVIVLAALVWQAITAKGNPNPDAGNLSPAAVALSSGILVFREGLEAILVLAAVTAGVVRNKHGFWRSMLVGIGAALAATVATWFLLIAIISSVNASELAVQAVTGLIAIVVLLVVMNWFFHKIYWTGWISHQVKKKKELTGTERTIRGISLGLAFLGFTTIYREGFEIVLFLQDLRLKAGDGIVLTGAGIGLILTAIVAALTFAVHQRLPYKKMLILTGGLLMLVLVVMVGESAQELQQAGWLTTHTLHWPIPDWVGTWFAVFPNIEGLAAQALVVFLVVGSYLKVRSTVPKGSRSRAELSEAKVRMEEASATAVVNRATDSTPAEIGH